MRGESTGANATELRKAHEGAVGLLEAVAGFREFARVFTLGKRPPAARFAAIGKEVKKLRTLLEGDGKKDKGVRVVIEPALVYFARVQETTAAVTVFGLTVASAHKGVIALVEEMLAAPWARPEFPEAFQSAADDKTGYLDSTTPDRNLYMAQQGLLRETLGSDEDSRVRALMEIEFAKALQMWRQPNDTSALTGLQWRILDLLEDPPEPKMTEQVISHRLKRHSGYGQVKGDLSDLRKRGLVDNVPGRGYFRLEA